MSTQKLFHNKKQDYLFTRISKTGQLLINLIAAVFSFILRGKEDEE
jgi:hypothetical protein